MTRTDEAKLRLREARQGVSHIVQEMQDRLRDYRADPCQRTRELLDATLDDYGDAIVYLRSLKQEDTDYA